MILYISGKSRFGVRDSSPRPGPGRVGRPGFGRFWWPAAGRRGEFPARQPQSLVQQHQSLAQQPLSLAQQQLWCQQQKYGGGHGCAAAAGILLLAQKYGGGALGP